MRPFPSSARASRVGIASPPSNGDDGDSAINPVTGRFFINGFDANGGFLVELVNRYPTYQNNGACGAAQQVAGLAFVCASCVGDLNGDGQVDAADLAQLLGNWGSYRPCPPYLPMDFDQDCTVGPADLAQLLGTWGPRE